MSIFHTAENVRDFYVHNGGDLRKAEESALLIEAVMAETIEQLLGNVLSVFMGLGDVRAAGGVVAKGGAVFGETLGEFVLPAGWRVCPGGVPVGEGIVQVPVEFKVKA